ncbi:hypothetical protein HN873_012423 [Arachis hypogaea]
MDQELRQFSTVWLKLAKVSRLGVSCTRQVDFQSYVKRPRINKRDFLAQVPTFQYQCPVITNVHIWNGQIERDLQGEVERINAKSMLE